VGMVRTAGAADGLWAFSPPAWDGPFFSASLAVAMLFSPPRGMVRLTSRTRDHDEVLPPAWGCPSIVFEATPVTSFSPPAWDGPATVFTARTRARFSPPAWGWSAFCARSSMRYRFSHPRGMVRIQALVPLAKRFSPPAWGWSVQRQGRPAMS